MATQFEIINGICETINSGVLPKGVTQTGLAKAFDEALRMKNPDIWKDKRRNEAALFEVLEQVGTIRQDGLTMAMISPFADVVNIAEGDTYVYNYPTGIRRARGFVVESAQDGHYKTFRLDKRSSLISTSNFGVGTYVNYSRQTLEDLSYFARIAAEGFVDRIVEAVQVALTASFTSTVRNANSAITMATGFDPAAMRKLMSYVKMRTGAPNVTILTSFEFASNMRNDMAWSADPSLPASSANPLVNGLVGQADLADVRNQGYVGRWFGADVIVLPITFTDEAGTQVSMNPQMAYVIPSSGSEKFLKVILEGSMKVRETAGEDWNPKIQMQRRMGVASVGDANDWGLAKDLSIDPYQF